MHLNDLILKVYIFLWFKIVFHKTTEENWKKFCVEISYSLTFMWRYLLKKTQFKSTIEYIHNIKL